MDFSAKQGPPVVTRWAEATFPALRGPAKILVVTMFFLLLMGCGFALNSPSGLATSPDSRHREELEGKQFLLPVPSRRSLDAPIRILESRMAIGA